MEPPWVSGRRTRTESFHLERCPSHRSPRIRDPRSARRQKPPGHGPGRSDRVAAAGSDALCTARRGSVIHVPRAGKNRQVTDLAGALPFAPLPAGPRPAFRAPARTATSRTWLERCPSHRSPRVRDPRSARRREPPGHGPGWSDRVAAAGSAALSTAPRGSVTRVPRAGRNRQVTDLARAIEWRPRVSRGGQAKRMSGAARLLDGAGRRDCRGEPLRSPSWAGARPAPTAND